MSNQSQKTKAPALTAAAVEETLKLYHAWLGYLLTRLETETLRVRAEDIRTALERISCSVSKEGEEYVIRLQAGKEAEHGGSTEANG